MSHKNGSSPKHITEVLQGSRNSSSYSSYSISSSSRNRISSSRSSSGSRSSSKEENANEKVRKKIEVLLKSKTPETIIARIKSISYIDKILTSMKGENKGGNVINVLIQRRVEVTQQMKQKEEEKKKAGYIEAPSKYKTKLKRLEKTLKRLLANQPHYIQQRKITTAILEKTNIDDKYLQSAVYEIKQHIESQEGIIKILKEQVCSRILTPKQVGLICWFMATFVAMFYSRRSREKILMASKGWDKKDKLFTLLKHVLDDKYLKSENEEKDYEKFSNDTFGNILRLLFEKDHNSFPYDPTHSLTGFFPDVYIGKLYNLLGVDYKMFDYMEEKDTSILAYDNPTLAYSYNNMEYDLLDYTFNGINGAYISSIKRHLYLTTYTNTYKYTEDTSAPTILIIRVCRKDDGRNTLYYHITGKLENNIISDIPTKNELTSMREEITYNGKKYILDSVIFVNWNYGQIDSTHSIAGITCKGIKYIYNGWTRTSKDPAMARQGITREIPCELQRHDWNAKDTDFCLNTRTCSPDILKERLQGESRHCFNFSEGERLLIYVRKDR